MADEVLADLLRDSKISEFNKRVDDAGGVVDLSGAILRGVDCRNAKLNKANLTGAYLRNADLRGVDLRNTILEGASMRNANVSGTYFPEAICAQEIMMSVELGTRIRVAANKPTTIKLQKT